MLNTFQVKEKYIVYVNAKNQVETYDFFTLEQTIYLPEKYNEVQLVRIENEHIFVVNKSAELIIDKIEK